MTHKTGIEEHYITKNNKKLQFGYTTGTCAAAATKASAVLLLTRKIPEYVEIDTPKGINLNLEPMNPILGDDFASCGIIKDAGDDPDITNGILVVSKVCLTDEGIDIDGGIGVGRVTKKGLEQPVGNAAINSVPRSMIRKSLVDIAEKYNYEGGFKVEISVPDGEETAEKTFNPRLGIVGGISILGTSGIVEPMSEQALINSLEVEIKQQIEVGHKNLVITLGNYGSSYLGNLNLDDSVKCSNYIGEAIDLAVNHGAKGILFVAHIGKFVKVAGGIMNTHSRNADCRAEIMSACALRAGASRDTAMQILDAVTTDDSIEILAKDGILDDTMRIVCDKIAFYLNHRCMGNLRTEALIFSNAHGYLGETQGFSDYLEDIVEDRKERRE